MGWSNGSWVNSSGRRSTLRKSFRWTLGLLSVELFVWIKDSRKHTYTPVSSQAGPVMTTTRSSCVTRFFSSPTAILSFSCWSCVFPPYRIVDSRNRTLGWI